MNQEVFNLEDALSINELEARQELSVAFGTEAIEAATKGDVKVERCGGNDVGITGTGGGGAGIDPNGFYYEP